MENAVPHQVSSSVHNKCEYLSWSDVEVCETQLPSIKERIYLPPTNRRLNGPVA